MHVKEHELIVRLILVLISQLFCTKIRAQQESSWRDRWSLLSFGSWMPREHHTSLCDEQKSRGQASWFELDEGIIECRTLLHVIHTKAAAAVLPSQEGTQARRSLVVSAFQTVEWEQLTLNFIIPSCWYDWGMRVRTQPPCSKAKQRNLISQQVAYTWRADASHISPSYCDS